MLPVTPTRQIGDLFRWSLRFRLSSLVNKTHHRVGVADIEIVVPKGKTKRQRQAGSKNKTSVGLSIVISITQNDDSRSAGISYENIAVGRESHPANISEISFREDACFKTRREMQRSARRLRNDVGWVFSIWSKIRRRQRCRRYLVTTRLFPLYVSCRTTEQQNAERDEKTRLPVEAF